MKISCAYSDGNNNNNNNNLISVEENSEMKDVKFILARQETDHEKADIKQGPDPVSEARTSAFS